MVDRICSPAKELLPDPQDWKCIALHGDRGLAEVLK